MRTDYTRAISKAPYLRSHNEMNWVLFGASGAGKSTTVARLLEDRSPTEFWRQLQDESTKKRHSVMTGVRIGHEVNSCTIVPTPFTLRPRLHITDMPSFDDSNAEKQISIDTLQKCFMTHIHSFYLLIVVEVGMIYQQRFQMLRDYHNTLWNLLGSEYQHGIHHFHFLLTKKSQMEGQRMSLDRMLNKGIRQLMTRGSDKGTGLFAQFLARLCDHHRIVDLETCSNESLLSDIQDMIQEGEEEAAGLHVPVVNVGQLAWGENKLSELCLRYIKDTALPKQKELAEKALVLEDEWKTESARILDETKGILAAVEKRMEREKKLEEVTAELDVYPATRAGLIDNFEAAKRRHVVCLEKLDMFRKESKDDDFISVRVNVSVGKKAKGGVQHTSEINVDVAGDGSTWEHIIVMDYEAKNQTLSSNLGGGISPAPDSIKKADDHDGTSLLFNSKTRVVRGGLGVERPPMQNNEGGRGLTLKCKATFKLEGTFQDEADAEAKTIEKLKKSIENLDAQNEINKDKTAYTREAEEAREAAKDVEEDVDALMENHPLEIQQMISNASELEDEVEAWEKHDLITKVGSIIGVLKKSNIKTLADPAYEEFTLNFRAIHQKLHGLKSAITTFEKADAESLEGTKNCQFAGFASLESTRSSSCTSEESQNDDRKIVIGDANKR